MGRGKERGGRERGRGKERGRRERGRGKERGGRERKRRSVENRKEIGSEGETKENKTQISTQALKKVRCP